MWNSVECPYCEYENDMSDALTDLSNNDNKFDTECSNCEREFEVEVEFDPQYSASKIVYEECEVCKTETRDICRKGKIFPYPKNIKGTQLCTTCFFRAMEREYAENDEVIT